MAVFVAWMKKTSYQKRETHAKGKSHNTEQKEREVNEKKVQHIIVSQISQIIGALKHRT